MNNPNGTGTGTYFIDYEAPTLRFFTDEYYVDTINDINYKHLQITDDSKYTIEHIVYYEEYPTDTSIPQYWIKYIVTDEYGNTTSKVQKIIFNTEPSRDEVKDFSEINNEKSSID